MTRVTRTSFIAGAAAADGTVVVVDVFRAFTAAAFALQAGVGRLVLADDLDEARLLAGHLGEAVLMGEEHGVKPDDFDLGNSPAEMLQRDVAGLTVVHRSSAGTRAVRAAMAGRARRVLAASFVVASATGRAMARDGKATVVAAGRYGTDAAGEDEACADFIAAVAEGHRPDRDAALRRAFGSTAARRLSDPASTWVEPADLGLCLAVDLFDFAMEAREEAGLVVLHRVEISPAD
jgi:2-phosphosulfolactate phosphatase